jgi:hypothetical protein
MKKMTLSGIRYALTLTMLIFLSGRGICQTSLPEVLNEGTLPEQMNYIEDRTRIYENYRAIREDMFQKIKKNSIDSLAKSKNTIIDLKDLTSVLNGRIDSLSTTLSATDNMLAEVTSTKNSMRLFGMEINKILYNAIMWIIVAGLVTLLGFGFLVFKRTLIVSNQTKKELEELKNEFEDYRQKTREAREKMSMDHFNELKRLKGG